MHLCQARSGSHLLALATKLDGPQSVITQVAVNEAPVDWIQHEAGWSDAAVEKLKNYCEQEDGQTMPITTSQCHEGRRRVEALRIASMGRTGTARCGQMYRAIEVMNALNQHLPKDDQLDWQEIYVTDHQSK